MEPGCIFLFVCLFFHETFCNYMKVLEVPMILFLSLNSEYSVEKNQAPEGKKIMKYESSNISRKILLL